MKKKNNLQSQVDFLIDFLKTNKINPKTKVSKVSLSKKMYIQCIHNLVNELPQSDDELRNILPIDIISLYMQASNTYNKRNQQEGSDTYNDSSSMDRFEHILGVTTMENTARIEEEVRSRLEAEKNGEPIARKRGRRSDAEKAIEEKLRKELGLQKEENNLRLVERSKTEENGDLNMPDVAPSLTCLLEAVAKIKERVAKNLKQLDEIERALNKLKN